MIHILTLVFLAAGNSSPGTGTGLTSIVAEYRTAQSCKAALDHNREALQKGLIILATCTAK